MTRRSCIANMPNGRPARKFLRICKTARRSFDEAMACLTGLAIRPALHRLENAISREHDRPRMKSTTWLNTMAPVALAIHLFAPVTVLAEVAAGKPATVKLVEVETFLRSLCNKAADKKDEACVSQATVAAALRDSGWCMDNSVSTRLEKTWTRCRLAPTQVVASRQDNGNRSPEQQACTLLTFTASSAAVWRDSGVPYERVRAYVEECLKPMPTCIRKNPHGCFE